MRLLSIQVGLPRELGDPASSDPMDKPWVSGFFKETVSGPVAASRLNLEGDGQADLRVHGGLDKAINVYPEEHRHYWESELELTMPPGAFGENFTVAGVAEGDVCIGDVFRIDGITVEISQPRQPCWKLARRWRIKELAVLVERSGRTGWYFRVKEEGTVAAPAGMELIERPHPEWTVALANEIMHRRKSDADSARRLANCPALSESWKTSLQRRAEKGATDTRSRTHGD